MTDARSEYLSNRALHTALTEAEASELAQALTENSVQKNDFVQLLMFWETWSQNVAPERSAEAFVAAWKTRQSAEIDSEGFAAAVESKLSNKPPSFIARLATSVGSWLVWLRQPASLACTAAAVVALVFGLWFVTTQTANARVSIAGEAVCPACVLHESREHSAAVRTRIAEAMQIYYLDRSPDLDKQQGVFCSGPNPIKVEGELRRPNGRLQLKAEHVEFPAKTTTNSARILFPL